MSDESALRAAIREHPLDDAPRLVYADWLDERGTTAASARAEFIRTQCEMELLAAYDPRYPALEAREKKLLRKWREVWLAELPKQYPDTEFWRGFPVPSLKSLSIKRLVKLTDRHLRAAPLWSYPRAPAENEFETLLAWPQLHRLTTFSLFLPLSRADWVERIAACNGLRNVTELAFTGSVRSVADLKRILDAWIGRRLTALWVNSCPIGDAGARLIAKHPATAGLRLFRAHTAELTSRGIKALVDSPNLDRVTLATFAHNPIGDTGGKHLLRWKALPGMSELYLMNTGLTPTVKAKFRTLLRKRVRL
jgi:uncharacterized protein (TIGR02996 family)